MKEITEAFKMSDGSKAMPLVFRAVVRAVASIGMVFIAFRTNNGVVTRGVIKTCVDTARQLTDELEK